MTIAERQKEVVDEFSFFEDWMEKYEHIISLGKELEIIDDEFRKDDKLIKGCQSRVWMHAEEKDGNIHFTADSDALITKGLVSLVIRVLNNQKPRDIAQSDLHFIEDIGLDSHLSMTRSNGLRAMLKQMKLYAVALESQQSVKN